MPNTLAFTDVEQWLCDHLSVGVAVATRVLPDTVFVRVERTGGPRATRVSDQPTVVVEAWASTETQAVALAETCRQALATLEGQSVGGFAVYQVVEQSGPVNLPDPVSSRVRYTQTFQLHLRGA